MDELAENLENTYASVQKVEKEEIAKKMVSWAEVDIYFGPIGWQDVSNLRLEEEENHVNAPQKPRSLSSLVTYCYPIGQNFTGIWNTRNPITSVVWGSHFFFVTISLHYLIVGNEYWYVTSHIFRLIKSTLLFHLLQKMHWQLLSWSALK